MTEKLHSMAKMINCQMAPPILCIRSRSIVRRAHWMQLNCTAFNVKDCDSDCVLGQRTNVNKSFSLHSSYPIQLYPLNEWWVFIAAQPITLTTYATCMHSTDYAHDRKFWHFLLSILALLLQKCFTLYSCCSLLILLSHLSSLQMLCCHLMLATYWLLIVNPNLRHSKWKLFLKPFISPVRRRILWQ